jgi:hypothetical protein
MAEMDTATQTALDAAIANANAAEARGDHAGRAAAATAALELKKTAYRPLPPENPTNAPPCRVQWSLTCTN